MDVVYIEKKCAIKIFIDTEMTFHTFKSLYSKFSGQLALQCDRKSPWNLMFQSVDGDADVEQ